MTLALRPATFLTGVTLAGCLIAALGAQACTVSVSDQPLDGGPLFPEDDASTNDGGIPGVTDPCSECLYPNCSAVYTSCVTNADCRAIYNCALQPGAVVNDCLAAHPNGASNYRSFSTCDKYFACTTCSAQCANNPIQSHCETVVPPAPDSGTTTPDDAGTTPDDASTPVADAQPQPVSCDTCVAASCASQKAACAEGTECKSFTNCLGTCLAGAPDKLDACTEACSTAYPNGKAAGDALTACTTTNCKAQCF